MTEQTSVSIELPPSLMGSLESKLFARLRKLAVHEEVKAQLDQQVQHAIEYRGNVTLKGEFLDEFITKIFHQTIEGDIKVEYTKQIKEGVTKALAGINLADVAADAMKSALEDKFHDVLHPREDDR